MCVRIYIHMCEGMFNYGRIKTPPKTILVTGGLFGVFLLSFCLGFFKDTVNTLFDSLLMELDKDSEPPNSCCQDQ